MGEFTETWLSVCEDLCGGVYCDLAQLLLFTPYLPFVQPLMPSFQSRWEHTRVM